MPSFSVKETFNFKGFLVGCYDAGLKLYHRKKDEAVDGSASFSGLTLEVNLDASTPEKISIIEEQITLFDDGQPTPPVVPQVVTPRQIRLAMLGAGISLAAIDALIDALPEPDKSDARISWEYSVEIDRSDPLVVNFGAALGLTAAQIDDLFIQAEAL